MKQIRKGIFETNSSSVHAICISKDNNPHYYVPDEIHFGFNDFGWEFEKYDSVSDKAAYLWTAICSSWEGYDEINEKKERIEQFIKSEYSDKDVTFTMPIKKDDYIECDWYIDHSSETIDFVNYVLDNKYNLFDYLFNYDSFVATGNDNSDEPVITDSDANEDTHCIFCKGN